MADNIKGYTKSDQPEALRLANDLEGKDDWRILDLAAATELRRQHAEIARLQAKCDALQKALRASFTSMKAVRELLDPSRVK